MSTRIILPNGYAISCESEDAAGVPDITQNAGENVMEAHEEAQKPVTDENAEYDAAHEADAGKEIEDIQDVAKANESTFYGLSILNRAAASKEAFGVSKAFSKMKFGSVKEAINSPEIKEALKTAKAWADKKGFKPASAKEVNENKKTLAEVLFRTPTAAHYGNAGSKMHTGVNSQAKWILYNASEGFVVLGLPDVLFVGRVVLYIFFTKGDKSKVFSKKLAVYKDRKDFAVESYGIFSGLFAAESDAAAAAAEAEKEPEKSDTPVTSEDTAETETTDVSVEEESEGTTTVAETETTSTEEPTKPEEGEGEGEGAAEASEEEKAIEAFFANWGN